MEGFYDKNGAASVLGVTPRQVTNYLSEGLLRRVPHAGKVWIPKADVHNLYDSKTKGVAPSRVEFRRLEQMVAKLQSEVEVIKLGLGVGAPARNRDEAELLTLRALYLDYLAKPGWATRRIAEVADEMLSLTEEEITTLCDAVGPTAWAPLFDLVKRMVTWVEHQDAFPEHGLDTLHQRLIRARDRMLGMLHASTVVATEVPATLATSLHAQLELTPTEIDRFVARYVRAYGESREN